MDVLFSWLGCFISVEWIFQVHSPISPVLSVWISWMMQPLTRRHLCDPLTRAVGTSFRCTRTVYFLYKNRCVDLFHIVNTLEFKSKWTYLNIWFADFKMDVHVLIMKKTSGKSVYETLWKLRKVVTSWLALPQWHGVCDEAWQVLSLPENMREPHPTHRSWKNININVHGKVTLDQHGVPSSHLHLHRIPMDSPLGIWTR